MNATMFRRPKCKSKAADKALLAQMLAEISRLEEQMDKDDADIERIKAETRLISAHSDQILSELKAQMDALHRDYKPLRSESGE